MNSIFDGYAYDNISSGMQQHTIVYTDPYYEQKYTIEYLPVVEGEHPPIFLNYQYRLEWPGNITVRGEYLDNLYQGARVSSKADFLLSDIGSIIKRHLYYNTHILNHILRAQPQNCMADLWRDVCIADIVALFSYIDDAIVDAEHVLNIADNSIDLCDAEHVLNIADNSIDLCDAEHVLNIADNSIDLCDAEHVPNVADNSIDLCDAEHVPNIADNSIDLCDAEHVPNQIDVLDNYIIGVIQQLKAQISDDLLSSELLAAVSTILTYIIEAYHTPKLSGVNDGDIAANLRLLPTNIFEEIINAIPSIQGVGNVMRTSLLADNIADVGSYFLDVIKADCTRVYNGDILLPLTDVQKRIYNIGALYLDDLLGGIAHYYIPRIVSYFEIVHGDRLTQYDSMTSPWGYSVANKYIYYNGINTNPLLNLATKITQRHYITTTHPIWSDKCINDIGLIQSLYILGDSLQYYPGVIMGGDNMPDVALSELITHRLAAILSADTLPNLKGGRNITKRFGTVLPCLRYGIDTTTRFGNVLDTAFAVKMVYPFRQAGLLSNGFITYRIERKLEVAPPIILSQGVLIQHIYDANVISDNAGGVHRYDLYANVISGDMGYIDYHTYAAGIIQYQWTQSVEHLWYMTISAMYMGEKMVPLRHNIVIPQHVHADIERREFLAQVDAKQRVADRLQRILHGSGISKQVVADKERLDKIATVSVGMVGDNQNESYRAQVSRFSPGDVLQHELDTSVILPAIAHKSDVAYISDVVLPSLANKVAEYIANILLPMLADRLKEYSTEMLLPTFADRLTEYGADMLLPTLADRLMEYSTEILLPIFADRLMTYGAEMLLPILADRLMEYSTEMLLPILSLRIKTLNTDMIKPILAERIRQLDTVLVNTIKASISRTHDTDVIIPILSNRRQIQNTELIKPIQFERVTYNYVELEELVEAIRDMSIEGVNRCEQILAVAILKPPPPWEHKKARLAWLIMGKPQNWDVWYWRKTR
jgi:hypothetical protein